MSKLWIGAAGSSRWIPPGAALIAAAAAFATLPVAAQSPTAAESFGESVDVRVVNVDVYVSDKKGRPIEGLTREDFVLYEDGVEVEISNFYAGSAEGRAVGSAMLPDTDAADPMPLLDPARPPLWAVLYIDNFSLAPADRTRVLDDLQRFVEARAGEDVRFLLATHELGLKTRGDFTRDPTTLVAALAEEGDGSPVGIQGEIEYRGVVRTLQNLIEIYTDAPQCPDPCVCAWEQMIGAWRAYSEAAGGRVGVSLNSLGELVSSLGGLSGRKAVFYVSSGLLQRPGIDVLKYIGDLCPHLEHNTTQEMWQYDETARLEELAARANANRVTLYPLDGGGLRADISSSVEYATARYRPSRLTGQMRTANLQGSLSFLADETGGRAILNANSPFEDLEETALDFDSFYSLGYSPPHEPDGKTHKIRVALREKRRVELRFRQSYRDKPLDERLGDRLLASLRFGVDDNPLAVIAEAGRPVALEKKFYEVPVKIRVPAGGLVTTGQDGAKGLVRVFLAAEDDQGRRTALKERLIEVSAGEIDSAADHEMVVAMRLRAGPHRISIGVRDEIGVEVSLLHLEVDVDPAAAMPAPPSAEG